jgi:sigma-B regulation protein RsbQ
MVDTRRSEFVQRPDGCSIAMRVYNPEATRAMILSNGLGCGEQMWRHLIADFARDHRVITWDYRGQGDSSDASGPGAYSPTALAADLAAVQHAAGVGAAVHVGFGLGALVVVEHHSWNRENVEALVLIQGGMSSGFGRIPLASALTREVLGRAAPLAPLLGRATRKLGGGALKLTHSLARRAGIVGRTCNIDDFEALVATVAEQREASLHALSRGVAGHQIAEVLAEVKVPTLVFAAEKDLFCPSSLMQGIHEMLFNSELEPLPGSSHTPLIDLGPHIAARTRRFLDERRRQEP